MRLMTLGTYWTEATDFAGYLLADSVWVFLEVAWLFLSVFFFFSIRWIEKTSSGAPSWIPVLHYGEFVFIKLNQSTVCFVVLS